VVKRAHALTIVSWLTPSKAHINSGSLMMIRRLGAGRQDGHATDYLLFDERQGLEDEGGAVLLVVVVEGEVPPGAVFFLQ
jgi:hypothetical protein